MNSRVVPQRFEIAVMGRRLFPPAASMPAETADEDDIHVYHSLLLTFCTITERPDWPVGHRLIVLRKFRRSKLFKVTG